MLQYTWDDFMVDARTIAASIRAGFRKHSAIYAVPRGGLVLGVYLSHTLELPLLTGIVAHPDPNVLVVDDNVVTGSVIAHYNALGCTTAVLVHNPIGSNVRPTLFGRESLEWPVFPWEQDSGYVWTSTKLKGVA